MHIFNGLLLGLSMGIFCLAYCGPIFLPQILAQKEKFKGWGVFIKFNLGRLLAYAIFGALFGFLGAEFHELYFLNFADWLIIFLSCLLILYGLGLSLPKLKLCALIKKVQFPFVSGFLVGINICPPFLLALTYNFKIGGILNGIIFFIMFFIGTTLYFIPLAFFGFFQKTDWIRKAARIAAVGIGIIMIIQVLI